MADVHEINDIAELQAYRLTWAALLGSTERASFFHTLDWLEAYWRHFGAGQKLRAMIVRAAGRPIGIVPLVVKTERRRFGKLRVLTYPLDNWGACYSPVGACQAATIALAMRCVASTRRDWDIIDLPWVDGPGADRGRTQHAMNRAGLRCAKRDGHANSVIAMQESGTQQPGWQAYLAGRCSRTRQEIRRGLRRFGDPAIGRIGSFRGEPVEYIRHRPAPRAAGDGDPAWRLYEECEAVARGSWQAASTNGNTLCHDRYQPFLRDAHAAAARCGMVDINVLRVGGRAVAYNYNYHAGGVVFGLRTGFCKDSGCSGAGMLLTTLTLRDSFDRGDTRFEMGTGEQDYKRRLRTGVAVATRLTHTPAASWRSQGVRLGMWLETRGLRPAPAGCVGPAAGATA
ncbi:MAG: GNAT family N-acetyltransferase [Planctomycetota bacterium]